MNIYRENIIERYKNPINLGSMKNYDIKANDLNLSCGDEVNIEIKLENNKIKDAKFQGRGCAISLASTDILLDYLKNKSINEIKKLNEKDIIKLLGINLTATRMNCAMLSLNALKNKIK